MSALELPPLPALVDGHVVHDRRGPVRHRFRNRHHAWLVEVPPSPTTGQPGTAWTAAEGGPPTVPGTSPLARRLSSRLRLRAADHLDGGRLGGGLRGDLDRWLARRGVDLRADDRVLLLAQPRVAGYVFNPLSVWWVLRDGDVLAVVAEVHNTYGERHAYLLRPDGDGRARHPKEFYVSPFHDVSGDYAIRVALGPERITVSIALHPAPGAPAVFGAAVTGRPLPITATRVLGTLLRQPGGSHRTSALIRAHGIWLWLRGLPVRARPPHTREAVR